MWFSQKNAIPYVRGPRVSVSPVLKFRYSSTKYHMSAFLSSDVNFPRQHAYYVYAVVGFSHKSTPRCITGVPEQQEPVYGVREIF